jgi:hypothetical protein
VPQPANATASAKAGANAVKRMQEYSVSICFMDRTVRCAIYSVFRGETQMKSPVFESEITPAGGANPG